MTKSSNSGIDHVHSSVTHTLGSNVENLTLAGTGTISGTGNSLNNTITGNGAANTLRGESGKDTLNGEGGRDVLYGGTSADYFIFDAIEVTKVGSARDVIGDFSRSQGDKSHWAITPTATRPTATRGFRTRFPAQQGSAIQQRDKGGGR